MNEAVFRTRLVMLRKEHHLTQGQIAEKLGLSRPSYTCYELGNSVPTLYTLCKIADMFEVNMDYLLGRSENPAIGAKNSPCFSSVFPNFIIPQKRICYI